MAVTASDDGDGDAEGDGDIDDGTAGANAISDGATRHLPPSLLPAFKSSSCCHSGFSFSCCFSHREAATNYTSSEHDTWPSLPQKSTHPEHTHTNYLSIYLSFYHI